MERLYTVHKVRNSSEATPLWTLTTLDAGGLETSEKVMVPGVWETHPRLKNYHGRAVYEQQIQCGGNMLFRFGGVSFRAKVKLDGKQIAEHYGAYTAFEALAECVAEGMHTLSVEVDNRFGEDSALHIPNDYYSYGGINRPVVIDRVGEAFIHGMHVIPEKRDGVWHAMVTVRVQSIHAEGMHDLQLDIGGVGMTVPVTLTKGAACDAVADVVCPAAAVWSPDAPNMTEAVAVLKKDGVPFDDLIERFGFREVQVHGRQILLNGEPIRLKGFNRHEDFNDYGVSSPVEAMFRDIQLMKDIGANCIRTCHYPNDPRFLDLCDEMGMLVWEESHARGIVEERMRNPHFMPQLKQCTQEMVLQHMNHPSIFIWGCLNECADNTEYGAACYREILAQLQSLDRSRPVTSALLERPGGKVYDAMDVVSVNIYPQWYHMTSVREAMDRKLAEVEANGGAGKPFIISEIGAGAVYGFHDPFGEAKWSEERQSSILQDQVRSVLSNPECTGIFLWQFADVRVDESWFASRPKTCNNKGIVDAYRRPKLAYAAIKELFHSM